MNKDGAERRAPREFEGERDAAERRERRAHRARPPRELEGEHRVGKARRRTQPPAGHLLWMGADARRALLRQITDDLLDEIADDLLDEIEEAEAEEAAKPSEADAPSE